VSLKLAETSLAKSRPSVPYGGNLCIVAYCSFCHWMDRSCGVFHVRFSEWDDAVHGSAKLQMSHTNVSLMQQVPNRSISRPDKATRPRFSVQYCCVVVFCWVLWLTGARSAQNKACCTNR